MIRRTTREEIDRLGPGGRVDGHALLREVDLDDDVGGGGEEEVGRVRGGDPVDVGGAGFDDLGDGAELRARAIVDFQADELEAVVLAFFELGEVGLRDLEQGAGELLD